jgi:hypothetical protein
MGAAEASGTGKKDCGVSWGKLDMYKLDIIPNQQFCKKRVFWKKDCGVSRGKLDMYK